MTESFDFDAYDKDYFQNLVSHIASNPEWEYSEDSSRIDKIASQASEFQTEEHFYLEHHETDGEIRLHTAHLSEPLSAAAGTLYQPLDHELARPEIEGELTELLSKANQSIAEDHSTEYLSTKHNPAHVAAITIPFDYDQDGIDDTLEAASQISYEVQDMNEEIEEAIKSRI